MDKKHINFSYMVDCMVIILELSCCLTFIPSFTFLKIVSNPIIFITFFCFFFHLIRFGVNFIVFEKALRHFYLWPFLLLYIVEIIQHPDFSRICLFFNVVIFTSYLYNVCRDDTICFPSSFQRILFPYMAFSLYNVLVICLLAMLIFVGFPHHINSIPLSDPLLVGHRDWDMVCYFPYYLSISQDYHIISLFDIPVLSGLCHEPHVIMYLITPAVVFSFAFVKDKKWLIILLCMFVFVLLETLSTTAILCVVAILVIELFWRLRDSFKYSFISILLLLLVGFYLYNSEMWQQLSAQLEYKLVGEGTSSGDTSNSMISYIYNIQGLFGEGNFPSNYGRELGHRYAGIITMFFDTIVYLSMTIVSIIAIFSKKKNKHYIGLGCFYYILHGTKVNYLMVSYPYFIFIFFITYLINNNNLQDKIKYARL